MKTIRKALLPILLFVISSFGLADTVSQVLVSGNHHIPVTDILSQLTVKSGEELSTENVMKDIDTIYSMGFFKDNVAADTVKVGKGPSGNRVNVVYTLEENPYVDKIYFVGMTAFTPAQLQASMNVHEGRILNYSDLRTDIQTITNYYHERGYVLMTMKEIVEPKDDNQLTFVIREGQIEDIFIKGLTYTKPYVVTREMQVHVGDAFNINNLQDDMRSVYNTGFFEDLNIDPPVAGLNPDKVVAILNMKEKRSGSLQFGGGVGSASGLFGFLKLEFMNFLGEGYDTSIQGQWGQTQTTYELKYHNPWFYPDHTYLTARLWNTNGQIDPGAGLNAFNNGGELTMGKPITREMSGFVSVRLNNVTPLDSSGNAAATGSYQTRSIGGGLSYDSRDYRFNPSRGDYAVINANTSLKALGASVEFLKYQVKWYKYFPVMENVALGFKGTFDDALGTIFDTERYYMGGATTVRGYQDGSPIAMGGRRYLGTVELRYNLSQAMQLYLFFDLGKVTQGSADCTLYGDSSWRTGKGIGFKVTTPIGPLRFDYAWGDGKPYNEGLQSGGGMVHFNIENSF